MAILQLDNSHIYPATAPETELTLPLTFLDIKWIHFQPIRRLLFYKFTASKHEFVNTVVPRLKHSLSLTLKHYLPLAGNLLLYTMDENKPLFRYVNGDYVSLTVAESTKDFDYLTGYHARDADEFYDFVPELPPVREENSYKLVPLLALQVTIFPGCGICIGFSNLHCVGDANSIFRFIKAWSTINKLGGDEELLKSKNELLPNFDRTLVKDPLGIDTIYWNVCKHTPFKSKMYSLPTERVRQTFVLKEADIKTLKESVLSRNPGLGFVSSFVVSAAYAWTSFVKSGEEGKSNEMLLFPSDVRARVDPLVPANYFGNFLWFGNTIIPRNELVGDEGVVRAATAIAEVIKKKLNKKEEVMKGAENLMTELKKMFVGVNTLGISGSPKFDMYGVDFGWGRAEKVEAMTIDAEKYSMSMCKSRDYEGGLEFGFSLSKERMAKFSAIFLKGLQV